MIVDFSPALENLQNMIDRFITLIPNMLVALLVIIVFYVAGTLVRNLVRRVTRRYTRHAAVGILLGRLSRWLIVVLGTLLGLVIIFPSFTPTRLLELLGITTVAIGFAFRDVLQNFVAGVLILLNEPFRIGDQIVVNDYEGTVEDIQTRATTIVTYDRRRVVIPNIDLFINAVTVNTAFPHRRVEYDVGIGYGDDVERAKEIILSTLSGLDDLVEDPAPEVIVVGLDPSTVTLRVRWWIEPARRAEAVDTRNQVLALIKEALLANGIDLPYPTRQILFHDQTEETDGDRTRQREGWPAGPDGAPQPRTIARMLAQR